MKFHSSRAFLILFSIISVSLFLLSTVNPSLAANASYTYDNGNRLIRVNYDDGSKIEYSYDESGNRTIKAITALDTTAPVTTAAPTGGSYEAAQSVTLTCDDGGGTGCDKIYYTTDGSTPTTASNVYASAIALSATTTLKFFATDLAGNSESVKTQTYTIISPSNPVCITGEVPACYSTLQAAYDAANDGATIRVKAESLVENLNVNRNISVSIEGGYSSDFLSRTGVTTMKGMIQTYSGGGTLTIKDFILNTN